MLHPAQINIACEAFSADLAEDSGQLLVAVRFLACDPYFTRIN